MLCMADHAIDKDSRRHHKNKIFGEKVSGVAQIPCGVVRDWVAISLRLQICGCDAGETLVSILYHP